VPSVDRQPRILIYGIDRGPRSVALRKKRLLIGRSEQADVHLPDETVSNDHLEIERHGGTFRATDLDSRNGTIINGKRIDRPTRLNDGDVIQVSSFRLEVVLPRHQGTAQGKDFRVDLTDDECQVAKALVAPYRDPENYAPGPASRAEIAQALHTSESSVKRRLNDLAAKLKVPAGAKRDRPRLIADRILELGIDRQC
jgi:pSer/pThr/pTyr-binding forkhead associated (FHA) protein